MPQNDFWKRLEGINAGMLGIEGAGRFVPMSHYPDQETQKIWFISAKGTEMAEAAEAVATCAYLVADASKGLYAHAVGALTLSTTGPSWKSFGTPLHPAGTSRVWTTPTCGCCACRFLGPKPG